MDVLGFKMRLDPNECVDRNLWFTPHLYDRDDINFAVSYLNEFVGNDDSVFIDVGANIGFWSLAISEKVKKSRIISVEANPSTAELLEGNIFLNDINNIEVVDNGLGGSAGELSLFCGNHGNRGGDSFKHKHKNATEVLVKIITLKMLCDEYKVDSIHFMRIGIECMEADVLEAFFSDAPISLYPRCICLEHSRNNKLDRLVAKNHYELIHSFRENSIYRLTQTANNQC